jgi:hypothetical protein
VRRINEKIFKGNKIIVQLDSSSLWKMKEKELQDSDAEMEKSLLMAGLEMKEQRCPNFSSQKLLNKLLQLSVSFATPGVDQGPIYPSMQTSIDSEQKPQFNSKQHADLESDPQHSTKQTKDRETEATTTDKMALATDHVSSHSAVSQYTSDVEMQWQQTVEQEERTQELKHSLDSLNLVSQLM